MTVIWAEDFNGTEEVPPEDTEKVEEEQDTPVSQPESRGEIKDPIDQLSEAETKAFNAEAVNEEAEEELPPGIKSFMLFSLADKSFGIPIEKIIEVVQPSQITPVPASPPHLKGISNLRGNTLPIVDLRSYYNISHEDEEDVSIIVLSIQEQQIGLVVNQVKSIAHLDMDKVEQNPWDDILDNDQGSQIVHYDGELVRIFDIDQIITEPFLASTFSFSHSSN